MSCLLRGLKWPKTGLRENRVIFQFPEVFKHSPKTGWWPRTGGFTLFVARKKKFAANFFQICGENLENIWHKNDFFCT